MPPAPANVAVANEVSDDDEPPESAPAPPAAAPAPSRCAFDSIQGAAPDGGSDDETTGDDDDAEMEGDEHAQLVSGTEDPIDARAVASRIHSAPDVIVAEAEASHNSVDAEEAPGARPAVHGSAAPHVPAVVDPSFANSNAVLKASGPAWEWYKLDMSMVEHAVVHEGHTKAMDVSWDLYCRGGKMRLQEQNLHYGREKNADTMIAQAIVLGVNDPDVSDDPEVASKAKPKKLFLVPVQLVQIPHDNKQLQGRLPDLEGCMTLMAIEPDVVQKLYWKKDIGSKTLPTDLHPDRVDYVSFQPHGYWKKFAPHQNTWKLHSATERRPSGTRKPRAVLGEHAPPDGGAAPAPAPAPASAPVEQPDVEQPAPKRAKPTPVAANGDAATATGTLDAFVRPGKKGQGANGAAPNPTPARASTSATANEPSGSVPTWHEEVDLMLQDEKGRTHVYNDSTKFKPLVTAPNCGVHKISYLPGTCLVQAVTAVGNDVYITLKDPNGD
jgi:hypothetical protein